MWTVRFSTRIRGRSSTASSAPLSGAWFRNGRVQRRLADLQPRVLRQLHHGQRQHLAVPRRRSAALPLPAAQWLPVADPDPEASTIRRSMSGRSATRVASLRTGSSLKEILLMPAERADLIVDFSQREARQDRHDGQQRHPDAPFGGGGFRASDPQSTGLVMQFRVVDGRGSRSHDTASQYDHA